MDVILFGPAAIIGLVAGLMGVLTRASPDAHDATLLRTVGATPRSLIVIAALETLIMALTTLACTATAVFLPTALYAAGFHQKEGLNVPIVFDMTAAGIIIAAAAALVFLIKITPLVSRGPLNVRLGTT